MTQIVKNGMMSYRESAKAALLNGCQWFQLRMDNVTDKDIVNVAKSIKALCDEYHAYFIIEDHVHLVKEIKANGVHLNRKGASVNEARKALGCRYFISVNADSQEEKDLFRKQGADCTCEGKMGMNIFRMKINGKEGYLSHIA